VAENFEHPVKGVLTYQFRIQKPGDFQRTSTQQSREVVVGYFVSNHRMQGVRSIRVRGLNNAMSARRR
jgi:hypothetical protein